MQGQFNSVRRNSIVPSPYTVLENLHNHLLNYFVVFKSQDTSYRRFCEETHSELTFNLHNHCFISCIHFIQV